MVEVVHQITLFPYAPRTHRYKTLVMQTLMGTSAFVRMSLEAISGLSMWKSLQAVHLCLHTNDTKPVLQDAQRYKPSRTDYELLISKIMKSDIWFRKFRGYTGTYADNNLHTHHTPIANLFTHVGMLGQGVLD